MTGKCEAEVAPPVDEVREVLNTTRQVDPTASEAEIRGYLLEVEEAKAMLDSMEPSGAAPLECFSAVWPVGSER
jgi:hypothetical protein